VCCSVLQCVAVCCSVLQCVAVFVEVFVHCVYGGRSVYVSREYFWSRRTRLVVLPCVAVCCTLIWCCNVLQCVAVATIEASLNCQVSFEWEPNLTYGWVMSHIWMSHVSHTDESCLTYGESPLLQQFVNLRNVATAHAYCACLCVS